MHNSIHLPNVQYIDKRICIQQNHVCHFAFFDRSNQARQPSRGRTAFRRHDDCLRRRHTELSHQAFNRVDGSKPHIGMGLGVPDDIVIGRRVTITCDDNLAACLDQRTLIFLSKRRERIVGARQLRSQRFLQSRRSVAIRSN